MSLFFPKDEAPGQLLPDPGPQGPPGPTGPAGTTEWNGISGKPSTFAPSAHKASHATGGSDALAPSDIGALGLSANSYVIARPGDNLAAKYAEAKVVTPQGNARSATNRASLIIFPGTYSLAAELAIDTEFVDIIGLGAQFQSPAVIVTNNTLNVTANDVRVSGVSVGTQSFKIGNNKPLQRFENCVGGDGSFASGVSGQASGNFVGCVAGVDSFGGDGTASGTFIDCVAGDISFGGIGSGIFIRCVAGAESFGKGTASGKFTNCQGAESICFGGDGTLTGELVSCRITGAGSVYQTPSGSGIIRFCLDGDNNIVNAEAP